MNIKFHLTVLAITLILIIGTCIIIKLGILYPLATPMLISFAVVYVWVALIKAHYDKHTAWQKSILDSHNEDNNDIV